MKEHLFKDHNFFEGNLKDILYHLVDKEPSLCGPLPRLITFPAKVMAIEHVAFQESGKKEEKKKNKRKCTVGLSECVCTAVFPFLPVSDSSGKKGAVPVCDTEPDVLSAHVDTSFLVSLHEKQSDICTHTHAPLIIRK